MLLLILQKQLNLTQNMRMLIALEVWQKITF